MFGARPLLTAAVAVTLVTLTIAAAAASSPEACVARTAALVCPAAKSYVDAGEAKRKVDLRALPPRHSGAKRTLGPPPPPAPESPEDLRKPSAAKLRKKQLLLDEIGRLDRLIAATPRKSPDRPTLIGRLAEDYAELEQIARATQTRLELFTQEQQKRKRTSEAARARREAQKERALAESARKSAITQYRRLAAEHPSHPRLDRTLYYLAYEHEQGGDVASARKVYLELIQKAPSSPYVPNAYFSFGELFFQQAMADPTQWELAAQAYREVIRYPAPENKLSAFAHYKLAYVHWNRGEHADAMSELKRTLEVTRLFPDFPNSQSLTNAARRDLVPLYASAGAPERAWAFFQPLSGDRLDGSDGGRRPSAGLADERSRTLRLVGELGLAYLDTGHYKEAIVLYRDLLTRDPGERTCDYQVRIVEATAALRSGDKEAIERELMRQLEVQKDFVRRGHPDRKKLECSNRTAELLSETAMAWHLEAVGSGGVRGTFDPKTMARAERLYRAVLAGFDWEEFGHFEFPRIVREDWPTRARLAHARADLLYEQGRFQECGPAYAEVAAEDPEGKDTPSALYGSAVCWQKAFVQKHAAGEHRRGRGLGPGEPARRTSWDRLQPKPLSGEQRSIIEAFDRFLCMVKPPRAAGEALDRYVEVKFARARTYFEAQHWDEAASGFRDVALNHPNHDAGLYAGHLWLEAVNVLGTHAEPKRPGCLETLGEAVTAISSRYCQGEQARGHEQLCQPLVQVQCDVSRKRAEKLVAEADSGATKNPLEHYARAADQLLSLYRKFGEAPVRAVGQSGRTPAAANPTGAKPLCRGMDEIVYNMAKAYQAARLLAKAIEVRLILVDASSGFSQTPLAKRALYELGQNYQAIAVYDRAALFYERYAAATRHAGEDADRALSDAVVLRLGLGDAKQALENARAFEQRFGRKKPERSAEIALALSNHHAERNDWAAARRVLEAALPLIAERAHIDIRVQAHAVLARAHSELGRGRDAQRHYEEVRSLWGDGARAVAAMERAEPDPALRERRIGRAVTAVGEALFFAAEARRAELERLRFPVYRGPGTKAEVLKHIQGEVTRWIGEKRPLVEQATAAFKLILDIQPAAPPVWVIAAGARVGEIWATFASELRLAPVPDSIRKQPELYQAYINAIEQVTAPQQLMARRAFETCTSWSVKYQYSDALSRKCEEWLAQNYKAEYHLIDEFRGAPNRSSSPLSERSPALMLGGTAANRR